jgi:hypothetical protein
MVVGISIDDKLKQYLDERLDDQISWFSKKAADQKRRFHSYQTIVIILGAIIPLVNIINFLPIETQVLSSLLGGLVSIFTAFNQLNKYQENWINYRDILEQLKKERVLCIYNAGDYFAMKDDEKIRKFIEKIETILSTGVMDKKKEG